eukprot:7062743-Pyramimonas_sp.AAC.1
MEISQRAAMHESLSERRTWITEPTAAGILHMSLKLKPLPQHEAIVGDSVLFHPIGVIDFKQVSFKRLWAPKVLDEASAV